MLQIIFLISLTNSFISIDFSSPELKFLKVGFPDLISFSPYKITAVILYGENEIKSGKPTLRNLSSGEEKSIEIKELVNEIKKII